MRNGVVAICEQEQTVCIALHEPYLQQAEITEGSIRMTLGPHDYFVLGDNRKFSYDSRRWGVLNRDDIVGRVWVRLWPFAAATVFAAPAYQSAP